VRFRVSPGPTRVWLGLFMLFAVVAGSLLGCSPKKNTKAPFVVAAGEKDAQSQIRRLNERWELATPTGKQELRGELEEFMRRHPKDPTTQQARLMLAQVALYERRYGGAVDLLAPLLKGRAGRTKDEAQLLMAAVEIRQGQVEAGLSRLAPLEGKLLSRPAEAMFYRERISAALAVRRWRLAVDSMQAWLDKPEHASEAEVRTWILQALTSIPGTALFRMVEPPENAPLVEPVAEPQRWLQHAMIERIARDALAQKDAALARDLLQCAPSWLRTGELWESLLLLSSQAQATAQITGRSLGFLLGGTGEVARGRNLQVAAGVLAAVRDNQQRGVAINYVTAEDDGSTASALGDLSGKGATYVMGGVDEASSRAALLFAQTREVPTLVMSQPRVAPGPSEFGFVVGVSEQEQVEAFMRAQPEGVEPFVLGGEDLPCSQLSGVGLGSAASRPKAPGLFLGDARCLHQVSAQLQASQAQRGPWTLGLASAAGPFPTGLSFVVLSAGAFPAFSSPSADAERKPAALARDWFFAVGYDGAQLLIRALAELPEKAVTDHKEVRAFHQRAAGILRGVRVPLLTSDQQGFGEKLRIERELSLRPLGTSEQRR